MTGREGMASMSVGGILYGPGRGQSLAPARNTQQAIVMTRRANSSSLTKQLATGDDVFCLP